MEYKKPQTTIVQGGVGIYPLTTADQVILADGSRLEKDGKISVSVADSAKLGGKAPEYYLTPRNLLDNSDFTNPVNQRGKTTYGDNNYTIDRFKQVDGTLTVSDGYINFATNADLAYKRLSQVLEHPLEANRPYTIAMYAKVNDVGSYGVIFRPATSGGSGISGSDGLRITNTTTDFTWYVYDFTPTVNTAQMCEILASKNEGSTVDVDIKYMCCYAGAYTESTLPPYVPKGYAAELAECQRYYYQSWTGSSPNTFNGMIICEAITKARATNVVFPQTMRIGNPTVTFYAPATGNAGKVSEFISDAEVDAGVVYLTRHGTALANTASAFEIGKHYCIHYSVSADL